MEISRTSSACANACNVSGKKNDSVSAEVKQEAVENEAGAVFTKSENTDTKTYQKPKTKGAGMDVMLAEAERKINDFKAILGKYFNAQADFADKAMTNLKDKISERIKNATPEDIAAAQAQIAEGGHYSVDAVAGRIMDMAKSLSGGDPKKIELLRNAVEEGFKQATAAWGSSLPKICHDTLNKVRSEFDAWAASAGGKE